TAQQILTITDTFGTTQTSEGFIVKNTSIDIWNPIVVSEDGFLTLSPLGSWDKPYQTHYTIDPVTGKKEIVRTEVLQEDGSWGNPSDLGAKVTAKNFAGIESIKNLLHNDEI